MWFTIDAIPLINQFRKYSSCSSRAQHHAQEAEVKFSPARVKALSALHHEDRAFRRYRQPSANQSVAAELGDVLIVVPPWWGSGKLFIVVDDGNFSALFDNDAVYCVMV